MQKAFVAINLKSDDDPNLYADLGAITHVLNNRGKISIIVPYKGNESIYVRNGESLNISHVGQGKIQNSL